MFFHLPTGTIYANFPLLIYYYILRKISYTRWFEIHLKSLNYKNISRINL